MSGTFNVKQISQVNVKSQIIHEIVKINLTFNF